MKKQIVERSKKVDTVQAMIEYLVSNGMSQISADTFIHVNLPALGDYRSLLDCMNEGKWDEAWNVVDMFLRGDFNA
jgi:hypothetical protein